MQTDFLITQDLTLSVYDFESFAINTKASTKKRSIIMPVVLTYKTKELMVFEKQGRKFVSKLENDIFLDRTTVRIGASDTTTLWAAAERLMKDYETVKKLPAFPKFSKLTDHTREEQDLNESISFVVFQQTRILKQGLQIVNILFDLPLSTLSMISAESQSLSSTSPLLQIQVTMKFFYKNQMESSLLNSAFILAAYSSIQDRHIGNLCLKAGPLK